MQTQIQQKKKSSFYFLPNLEHTHLISVHEFKLELGVTKYFSTIN